VKKYKQRSAVSEREAERGKDSRIEKTARMVRKQKK